MEYDPDTGALTARGIKTAQIQASESAAVTTPIVLVTASERITLDTPEVVCTQHLRARTLSITEGGTMQGTLTHSGGSLTSNGVTLDSHRQSGEGLSDMAHLRQSVADILQTPTGSRVMHRDYGSTLFALIDQPQTPALRLQIMAALYGALLRWEDRLTLTQLRLSSAASGKMTVDLVGQRTDTAAPLTLTLPLGG